MATMQWFNVFMNYMYMSSFIQSGLRTWDKECFLLFSRNLILLKWQNGLTNLPSQAKLLDRFEFFYHFNLAALHLKPTISRLIVVVKKKWKNNALFISMGTVFEWESASMKHCFSNYGLFCTRYCSLFG